MATQQRQRGVALITVMLVFALVAVVAAEMMRNGQLFRTSFANQLHARQAYHYALGGEALARQLLALDHQRDVPRDSLDESWATIGEELPFKIDEGEMKIKIVDLQGRFNLNNVVDDEGQVDQESMAQLTRLLEALSLDRRYAAEWLDWVDADQQVQGDGAEDADYDGYRTGGQRDADPSVLRLLRSMQVEDYRLLAPHVTVLPATTEINVNTATAPALRAMVPGLTAARAAQAVARQPGGGFATLADFQQVTGGAADGLSLQSAYFEVQVSVRYDDRWQHLRTVLHRDDGGKIRVVRRERTLPFGTDQGVSGSGTGQAASTGNIE